MRALVTGTGGFLGGQIVQDLRGQGVAVSALVRRPTGAPSCIGMGDAPWPVARLSGIIESVAPDVIFHLAGGAVGSQEQLERVNVGIAASIMQALQEVGTRPLLVCCGSAAEYGAAIADGIPAEETLPCAPISVYGVTKLAQTNAVRAFAESTGARVLIARIFNPIGPGMPGHLALAEFARDLAALGTRGVLRTGNIRVSRDFIDVSHVSAALLKLALSSDARGIVNICSGRATRLEELVRMLIAASGKDIAIEVAPERLRHGEPNVIVGSTKLLAGFGAVPPHTDYRDAVLRIWREASMRNG